VAEIRQKDWQQTGNGKLSAKQIRMFNAVCGDLEQIHWHGNKLHKDDWRHLFSAVAAGQRMMPGWHYGDGRAPGFIMLGKSSLSLTRSEASDAITMAIQLGDDPESQGIKACPVRWSNTVLMGMGFPEEIGNG
jgi:hypothetical protein